MTVNNQKPFRFTEIEVPYDGVEAYKVLFASTAIPCASQSPDQWSVTPGPVKMRRAIGRVVLLDPAKVELKIYPFYELIHRSWMPGTQNFVRLASTTNLGTKLSELVYDGGGPELRELSRFDETRGKQVTSEIQRCFFACNTLQTGFVRSNGFVIAPEPGETPPQPRVFHKPDGAFGLQDRDYVPLGPTARTGIAGAKREEANIAMGFDGNYDVIVLQPRPRVCQLKIEMNQCKEALPDLAICSPIVLTDANGGLKVKRPEEIRYCPNKVDQTIGNEVNWDPTTTCASFTAFGLTKNAERIVVVSMFESLRSTDPTRNRGITASEMGWLMSQPELGARNGVIGGGAADTQQFLDAERGDMPLLLEAPPRFKRPEEGGVVEVQGARGLGAIFAALQR